MHHDPWETGQQRMVFSSGWMRPNKEDLVEVPKKGETGPTWLTFPLLPRVEKGTEIWHYTDEDGLLGIVSSGLLRATSCGMLNDENEINFGLSRLSEELENCIVRERVAGAQANFARAILNDARVEVQQSRIFVVCGSLNQDELQQWISYGSSNASYAAVLNPTPSPSIISKDIRVFNTDFLLPRWTKVLYREQDWRPYLSKLSRLLLLLAPNKSVSIDVANAYNSHAVRALWQVVPFLKNPDYQHEAEVRLVYRVPFDLSREFRTGRYGITPYLNCGIPANDDEPPGIPGAIYSTFDGNTALPLASVVLGPRNIDSTHSVGVEALLRQFRYGIPVRKSVRTYR